MVTVDNLVERCARGDEAALCLIHDRFSAHLFSVAARMVGDRQLAESIVVETFVHIWRNSDRFDPRLGSATGWIIAILRYRAFDARSRLSGRPPTRNPQAGQDQPLAGGPGPGSGPGSGTGTGADRPLPTGIFQRSDVARLHQCLDNLPEQPRKMIAMAYLDGLTTDQIAQSANMAPAMAQSMIMQGLLRLKDCLMTHGR